MSAYVNSWSITLGPCLNASSKITQGLLETHAFTLECLIRSLKRAMRSWWGPSNSSKPSTKKQSLVVLLASWTATRSARCNSCSVHSCESSSKRHNASHLLGATLGTKWGSFCKIWYKRVRRRPSWVIWYWTPELQKKNVTVMKSELPAHSLRCFAHRDPKSNSSLTRSGPIKVPSVGVSVWHMYFISVDFPEPALPVIQ